jgi:hypothetical protein
VHPEALTRKERSIAILKSEGVPLIEHLPVIEIEAESLRRSAEEVATRAMALCVVAVKGEGLEQPIVEKLVQNFELAAAFTPKEMAFIKNLQPPQQDRIQFSWRYESYWVLLWALGFVDQLGRPDSVCDVGKAVTILQENGRGGFLQKATLRPQNEIVDAADLIYRYHWAVRNALLKGQKPPAGLHAGAVMERHYALNWLVGYMGQEWDNISTDT